MSTISFPTVMKSLFEKPKAIFLERLWPAIPRPFVNVAGYERGQKRGTVVLLFARLLGSNAEAENVAQPRVPRHCDMVACFKVEYLLKR